MTVIARVGERVMDAKTGKTICRVKNNLVTGSPVSASDFHQFLEDEKPWQEGHLLDKRCTIVDSPWLFGIRLFVEGEWRPSGA